MAEAVSLIAQNQSPKIDVLVVDAFLSETHNSESEVTEHPVEKGVNITDHIRPKPNTVALDGIITGTPLGPNTQPAGENRVETAIAFLRRLADEGRIVTLLTGAIQYDNMVMTSLSIPRNAQLGNAVRFSASFKAIRIVETQQVQLTKVVQTNAKAQVKGGKKAATQADDATRRKSLLSQADDFFTKGKVKKWIEGK